MWTSDYLENTSDEDLALDIFYEPSRELYGLDGSCKLLFTTVSTTLDLSKSSLFLFSTYSSHRGSSNWVEFEISCRSLRLQRVYLAIRSIIVNKERTEGTTDIGFSV